MFLFFVVEESLIIPSLTPPEPIGSLFQYINIIIAPGVPNAYLGGLCNICVLYRGLLNVLG